MILTHLEVDGFRNLESLAFDPHPRLNVLSGPNGAGKSSVLEAVQCLATGHTFRTRLARDYIAHGGRTLRIAARLTDVRDGREHRCGVQREPGGDVELRIDYRPAESIAELAALLPVKALTPDSHRLVQDGPDERRRFLDWGCFHRDPAFPAAWRSFRRALSQRNEVLRQRGSDGEVASWNGALIEHGTRLDAMRQAYVSDLAFHVKNRAQVIDFPFHMELALRAGWPEELTFEQALVERLEQHRRLRTTADGPHRADLVLRADGRLARPMLSRGQQKLLVYLLHLAQLDCLAASDDRRAVVLCDDPAAELDAPGLERVLAQLDTSGCQLFVTAADPLPDALRPARLGGGRHYALQGGKLQEV